MRPYKTKETALRHIYQGERLWTKPFQHFWCDKEVITEAVLCRPSALDFAFDENPGLKWDEEFITTLFQLMLKARTLRFSLDELGPYLPPEITDSKEVALKVADIAFGSFKFYFAPDLVFDKDVGSAYFGEHEPTPRMTREATVTHCAKYQSFRAAYGGLHDDEEFVLDVLKKIEKERERATTFAKASYRIRKACRGQNEMDHLEKFAAAKKLDGLLKKKAPIQLQRTGSKKI